MEHIDDILYLLNIDSTQLILYIIMIICGWLLLREIKCWYWKINEIVQEQKRQTEALYQIINELQIEKQKNNQNNNESTP